MGKKVCIGFFGLLIFLLLIPSQSSAHPGRTDANGGHTCRTNCEKWGLEYGEYHYHNGGNSGGSGGAVKKETPPPAPAPATTEKVTPPPAQAPKVDQKKLEEQRKQEELERKRAEEEEKARQKARQKAIKDRGLGEKEGAEKAKDDFENEEEKDPDKHIKGKSPHYAKAFKKSYAAAWKEKEEQKEYFDQGYEQGLSQEKMDLKEVPKKRQGVFEEGFKKGNKERVKKIKKEQYELGKKHGLKKKEINPGNKDRKRYVEAYNDGYKAGIKKTITKEGKKSANTNYSVKIPKQYKDHKDYSKWYKEGFDSNKKAAEVRKAGFKKGKKFFSTSWVPKKYKEYKGLYKAAYKQGKLAK